MGPNDISAPPSLYSGFTKNANLKQISLGIYIDSCPVEEWIELFAMLLSSISSTTVERINISFDGYYGRSGTFFSNFEWDSVDSILGTPKFAKLTAFDISCATATLADDDVTLALPYTLKRGILHFE